MKRIKLVISITTKTSNTVQINNKQILPELFELLWELEGVFKDNILITIFGFEILHIFPLIIFSNS